MIKGFSKLSKAEKIGLLSQLGLLTGNDILGLTQAEYSNAEVQQNIEGFSENVISSFQLPYSVAPNFLIDNKNYVVPMVTEESSVVAAASWSAQFWANYGGFKTKILGTEKIGQIFFQWSGSLADLESQHQVIHAYLVKETSSITANMEKRGGGVTSIEFLEHDLQNEVVFELRVSFETADSMGANFINTVLESMSVALINFAHQHFKGKASHVEIIMSILSNNTPNCTVECSVEAPFSAFNKFSANADGEQFARKFKKAVDIALADSYRAVTHNKGIFNGISAVLLATANDFRAVEAAGHAFAVKNGRYASLSSVKLGANLFRFTLKIPLAIGTVGGLTKTHPMAAQSFKILGDPNAKTLMSIIAAVGLASNFAAVKALVTGGIQQGHMKMHLNNILMQCNASAKQTDAAKTYFANKPISVSAVKHFLEQNM